MCKNENMILKSEKSSKYELFLIYLMEICYIKTSKKHCIHIRNKILQQRLTICTH